MIEHIRLSEKAKQQLIVIKRKTGIEKLECTLSLGALSLISRRVHPAA